MTATVTVDAPAFVAEKPKQREDSYRLIKVGEAYHLAIDSSVLCPAYIRKKDATRRVGGLAVAAEKERLLVRRGDAVVEEL